MLTTKELKNILTKSVEFNELISTGKILCAFIGGSYKNGLFVDGISDYDIILVYSDDSLLIPEQGVRKKYVIHISDNISLILQPWEAINGNLINGYHILAVMNLKKADILYINEEQPHYAEHLLKLAKTNLNIRKRYFATYTLLNYWYELYNKYIPANLNCGTSLKDKRIYRQIFIALALYFEGDYTQYAEELWNIKHGSLSTKTVAGYTKLYIKWCKLTNTDVAEEYRMLKEQYENLLK